MDNKREVLTYMMLIIVFGCMTIGLILSPVGATNQDVYNVKMMLAWVLILGLTIHTLLLIFS